MKKPIYVTQPSLPDLSEFGSYLEQIWKNKILTNNGDFHKELEDTLATYLGVPYISLFSNGTVALMSAIQALDLKGEVITTPYSFVATAHSIWWNKIKPVFVDVDPETGNMDPAKIEDAITEYTTGILPVHVYGVPCEHSKIKEIADKHKLKLIYDAAHAFAVKENNQSVLNYGELSVLSFHATKVFNTIEGGAIVSQTLEMKKHIDYLKNFGFEDEVTVVEPGINGKMNELQAAFGLLQMKSVDKNIQKRRLIAKMYEEGLKGIKGVTVFIKEKEGVVCNYSYFPILVNEKKFGMSRDALYYMLQKNNIYGRRYFYPLITAFSPYKEKVAGRCLSSAEKIAQRVICLPIYSDLDLGDVERVCQLISAECI